MDFLNMLAAVLGVLLLGIVEGILLAALISVLLLARYSTPHVAFPGRIPGTRQYSDVERHPDNEPLIGVIAFRPEASLLCLNAEYVLAQVLARLNTMGAESIRTVICDLPGSPIMDLSGARMLAELNENLHASGLALKKSFRPIQLPSHAHKQLHVLPADYRGYGIVRREHEMPVKVWTSAAGICVECIYSVFFLTLLRDGAAGHDGNRDHGGGGKSASDRIIISPFPRFSLSDVVRQLPRRVALQTTAVRLQGAAVGYLPLARPLGYAVSNEPEAGHGQSSGS
jgi:hypothetical protein